MWVKRNAGLVLMTICIIMCLDTANATCSPECGLNGVCDATDSKCLCTSPYYSAVPGTAACDTPAAPATCDGGSAPCDLPEVCTTAATCSSDLDPTCTTLACAAGSMCMTESDGSAVRCHSCPVGMTGGQCECTAANVDYDPVTGTCWCKAGQGGADCSIACDQTCTDGCTSTGTTGCIVPTACPANACVKGQCTSYHAGTASYKCRCDAGVTGADCDKCSSDAGCAAGQTCNVTTGACACATGYTGTNCDTCSTNVGCNSNGVCTVADGTCTCETGFTGTYCETCMSEVGCHSKGTCTGGVCTCTTPADYTGTFCELCATHDGCNLANGTCLTNGTCSCNAGFAGGFCQHACASPCESCQLPEDGLSAECSGSLGIMASVTLVVLAVIRRLL